MPHWIQGTTLLGHVVSRDEFRPDRDKIAAVSKFPTPVDKRAVGRLIAIFTAIAAPLTHLTRDDIVFEWTDKQQVAFDELGHRLQTTPVLAHFDEEALTIIHSDASNVGLAAVLMQVEDGVERVVAYASRALSGKRTIQQPRKNV